MSGLDRLPTSKQACVAPTVPMAKVCFPGCCCRRDLERLHPELLPAQALPALGKESKKGQKLDWCRVARCRSSVCAAVLEGDFKRAKHLHTPGRLLACPTVYTSLRQRSCVRESRASGHSH
eukprot:3714198-Amphidinium_carterae.1